MNSSSIVTLFSTILTVGVYLLSRQAARKYPSPFTTPVFFSTTIIIMILLLSKVTYTEYEPAKEMITFLLGPATVALAVPLYKNKEIILKNLVSVGVGLVTGSFATIFSVVLISKIFHLSNTIVASISIKSVTVPVAIEVAEIIGGDPALTAAFVIFTGIVGTMIGPWIMNKTGITNPLSRGLSLGTISHGIGTAGAASEGELQGAIAGVAMGIAAIFTSMIAPLLIPFL